MQIREGRPPRSGQLKRVGVELGRAAKARLMWMDYYRTTGNVALTCRHFGISRQTFYRWQRRYDPLDLTTLEDHSHRPRRIRQPTWSFLLEEKVLTLRLQFPPLGQRQAGRAAPPPADRDLHFHAGTHSPPSPAARPAGGTTAHRSARVAAVAAGAAAPSLCGAQTQAVRGVPTRRPGRGPYSGGASGA